MRRIAHETQQTDAFGPGKHGFTGGDASAQIPPTVLTPDWANAVQEELANAVERMFPLVADSSFQLANVLATMADALVISTMRIQSEVAGNDANAAASNASGQVIVTVGQAVYHTLDGGFTWGENSLASLGGGPDAELFDVAYSAAENTFVAVGAQGTIRRSNYDNLFEGWSRRTPAADWVAFFRHVHYHEELAVWLVGGSDGHLDASSIGTLQRSDDNGESWSALSPPAAGYYGPFASDRQVIVCAARHRLLRSVDATVWTEAEIDQPPLGGYFFAVQRVPGGWIALAYASSLDPEQLFHGYASTDSVNWTHFALPAGMTVSNRAHIDARTGAVIDELMLYPAAGFGAYGERVVVLAPTNEGTPWLRRINRRWIARRYLNTDEGAGERIFLSGLQLF